MNHEDQWPRRKFLGAMGVAAGAFAAPGAFAEALTLTPRQTEGPFYPNKLPLDTDNDLLIINDSITPAIGDVTHLTGRVLDAKGDPIRNARVEIWQVDNNGVYLHTGSNDRDQLDKNFQGFGKFLTSSTGEYYFRTLKPVPYPGRTPHIHFAIHAPGQPKFTTQCYIKGHEMNEGDGVLRRISDKAQRENIIIDFAKLPNVNTGELTANFDIVLGHTPEA